MNTRHGMSDENKLYVEKFVVPSEILKKWRSLVCLRAILG